MTIRLSHSDIQDFLKCRNLWDFRSGLRQARRPFTHAVELDVGTAWAKGMEAFYDPITWESDHKIARAMSEFISACDEQRERIYQNTDKPRDVVDAEIAERIELGKGMLKYFFGWSKVNDAHLVPKRVEWEFEVPILDPLGTQLYVEGDVPAAHTEPVVFAGRIDRLFYDAKWDVYWLGEDKTAGEFKEADWLEIDPQTSRYMWALEQADDIRVAGMIWTQFKKEYPKPTKINKNGEVSVDRRQTTTDALLQAAIIEQHGPPDQWSPAGTDEFVPMRDRTRVNYGEYLQYLKDRQARDYSGEQPWLIRRVYQTVSPAISQRMGEQLYTLATEMLDDPKIYPNENAINCQRCPFRVPCLLRHEGDDWEFVLKHNFEKKDAVEAQTTGLVQ